jgi:hypothetical protein
MLRLFSWGSFAGLFLLISPKLRFQLLGCLDSSLQSIDAHAPYSYIGLAVLVMSVFLFSLARGAQASCRPGTNRHDHWVGDQTEDGVVAPVERLSRERNRRSQGAMWDTSPIRVP